MATASFEKNFIVQDSASIERLERELASPRTAKVSKRDYKIENTRSIEILKQRLSNSKTC